MKHSLPSFLWEPILGLVSTICFPHVEKKEHVEMCICDFVFQRYGKSTYGFRIFRHLSGSVCIILTSSLEHGEPGHVDGSICFLFSLYMHITVETCDKKAAPSISFTVCSSVSFYFSVFFFSLLIM